jgi:hypothetical protein
MNTREIPARKYFARVIRQQRNDLADYLITAYEQTLASIESGTLNGSAFADTVRWSKGHPNAQLITDVSLLGIDNSLMLAKAADDHVESIAVLMGGDREAYVSTIALLRSAAEAVIQICYFFDPDVPPVKRLLRAAAYQVESVTGMLKTLRAYGPRMTDAEIGAKESAGKDLLDVLIAGGLKISRLSPKDEFFGQVEFDGVRERTRFNATDAFNKFIPGEPFEWQTASGATHSLGWFLVSMVGGSAPAGTTDEMTYGATTISLLNLADALIRVVGQASGVDNTAVLKRSFDRRKAVLAKAKNQSFSPIDRETYDSRSVGKKLSTLGRDSIFRRAGKRSHRSG